MRKNRRRKTTWQKLKPFVKATPFVAFIVFLAWQAYNLDTDKLLEVKISWQIDNEDLNPKEQLNKSISGLIVNNYEIDLNKIKKALEKNPWVADAKIKRLHLDAISINISSQDINMRWKNIECDEKDKLSECVGFVSSKGVLFNPIKSIDSDKPLVISKHNQNKVLQAFKDYKKYQKILKPMVLKTIVKTNIDTLIVHPETTVVLGFDDQEQRLLDFKNAYKQLAKKTAKVRTATFDMRYPKGFSVDYDF